MITCIIIDSRHNNYACFQYMCISAFIFTFIQVAAKEEMYSTCSIQKHLVGQ